VSTQTAPSVHTDGDNGRRWGVAAMTLCVVAFVLGIVLMAQNYASSDSGFNAGALLASFGFFGGIATAIGMTVKYGRA
jgi:hypothetical protein